ncbi:MAG: SH3 domain-containing protein [Chloroflexi bacterium]|nr:SH3 domain-containing protein [Chloroflexota bacterium]
MKTSICISRKCFLTAVALLFLLPIAQAWAADITVDADCSLPNAIRSANGEDLVEPRIDCEPGDGVDEEEDNGQADDEVIPGLDTITIDIGGTDEGMIALDATLAISSVIVIDGNGFSLNGGGNQIFSVALGSLTLNDLTISNGFSLENGGAISVTGGALTLNNSAVRDSGARGLGGGIYALDSDVALIDSVVSGNATAASAEDYPPVEDEPEDEGQADASQAIEADAEGEAQTADDSETVESQTENSQEAEATEEPEEEVVPPEVEGRSGGGIYLSGESSSLVIDRSGVNGNASPERGGGIYIAGGSATIGNSTISGNSAGVDGGGIYNAGASILTHVTVVGNSAAKSGGIVDGAVLQLYNSILSDNTGGDCSGSLNANLGNLIRDKSCNHDGMTDDPMLLLLAGSPAYYLPQEGSPAIDAAVAEYCSQLDQRGIDRRPESCDIGAAEYQAGAFSFQIQSALAALTPGEGGGATDEEAEEAAATPASSDCSELPGHIVVTGDTLSLNCTMLDWQGVNNQTLVDGGALYAVDMVGLLASPLTVCFLHDSGAIVLLDAADSPRNILPLRTWPSDNMQCATVDRPGAAVYMPLGFFTSGAIAEPIWDLSDCAVTTTDILNLREGPSSSTSVLANVLNDVELAADQRATTFYRVNYYGIVGWLSQDYLSLSGECY